MKKLVFIFTIFAIFAITSTKSYAYSGYIYNDGSEYQIAQTYYNPGSYISYTLSIDHGGAYIGTSSGQDQIYSYTTSMTKSGNFSGSFSSVYMSAAVFSTPGYASVSATWY